MRGVRPWRSPVFRQLLACAEGMLYVLGGGLLTALLVWRLGLPSAGVLRLASRLIWCAGGLAAGYRAGRHGRRHGALEGMLCGAVLCLIWLCGAFMLHEQPKDVLLHCVLVGASGASGGIIGVNVRLKRPPN